MHPFYQRALIAAETVSRSLSSISVLVSLTALPRITRQISISFSPSSSFSGILATASEIIFDARGSRKESIVIELQQLYYLDHFFIFFPIAFAIALRRLCRYLSDLSTSPSLSISASAFPTGSSFFSAISSPSGS